MIDTPVAASPEAEDVLQTPSELPQTAAVEVSAPIHTITPKSIPSLFPVVGTTLGDFHLLRELGRGAFGRVYLARQHTLADRLVALKITLESLEEAEKLARMQHSFIMPVYSIHSFGSLHGICMPYHGSTTLADIYHSVKNRDSLPESGNYLVSTLNGRRAEAETWPSGLSTPPSSVPFLEPASVPPSRILPVGSTATVGVEAKAPEVHAPTPLEQIAKLSYVDAVVWLAQCIAEGLQHAHDRNLLHRDLKLANILITDDGQP
ncbi:MAG: protein kinase, partial [Gemmataceae bacterium]